MMISDVQARGPTSIDAMDPAIQLRGEPIAGGRYHLSTITRRSFVDSLKYGVKLDDERLARTLREIEVEPHRLTRLDRDGDGVLDGRELYALFRAVDRYDRDGSARTFARDGRAGLLYATLLASRRSGPYYGARIARVAASLARRRGTDYAFSAAPRSPNPALSHNRRPGTSRLRWLAQRNKCNVFVGDALHAAGMAAPSYRMSDGSVHYVNARALPRYRRHFDRLVRLRDARPGDIVVVRFPGMRGQDSAHAEVITAIDHQRKTMTCTGAHYDGAYRTTDSHHAAGPWYAALEEAGYDGRRQCWKMEGYEVYLLRPKRIR